MQWWYLTGLHGKPFCYRSWSLTSRLQHSLDRKKCAAKRVNNEMCWSVLDGLWASATLWQSCLVAAHSVHVSFSGTYWTWDESGFTLFDQWISMIVLQFFQSIMINIANSLYYESLIQLAENLTQKYLLQYGLSARFIWNIKYDQMWSYYRIILILPDSIAQFYFTLQNMSSLLFDML